MTETPPQTLAEAADRYLSTLGPSDPSARQSVLRFVQDVGGKQPLSRLEPHRVASYAEALDASTMNVTARIEPVKEFFRHCKKKGWTDENFANHLKARGQRRRTNGSVIEERKRIELTAEGHAKLQAELEELQARLPQLADAIRIAAADKDFRENQPYHAAREDKAKVDSRIKELEAILAVADIVSATGDNERVRIGGTVRVEDLHYNEQFEWTLVNPSEVDPRAGKISVESPIGRALLDRRSGEDVEVKAPAGIQRYRVLAIVK
jgi:transcription elongation factor GreA